MTWRSSGTTRNDHLIAIPRLSLRSHGIHSDRSWHQQTPILNCGISMRALALRELKNWSAQTQQFNAWTGVIIIRFFVWGKMPSNFGTSGNLRPWRPWESIKNPKYSSPEQHGRQKVNSGLSEIKKMLLDSTIGGTTASLTALNFHLILQIFFGIVQILSFLLLAKLENSTSTKTPRAIPSRPGYLCTLQK